MRFLSGIAILESDSLAAALIFAIASFWFVLTIVSLQAHYHLKFSTTRSIVYSKLYALS